MDVLERKAFEQMQDVLREIRKSAAGMVGGGAWAAKIADVCLSKLPEPDLPSSKITINRRYARAQQVFGGVMNIVGKYICDHGPVDLHRVCAYELLDLFFDKGVQIITDGERAEAGLPKRDENGLTEDELQVLENRMLEAMKATAMRAPQFAADQALKP